MSLQNYEWQNQYGREKFEESLDWSTRGFRGHCSRSYHQTFEIQNGGQKFEGSIVLA